MKFTKANTAALQLPAGKTDHFVWDDATPGFGVRLRGDRRTWVAQIRALGQTKRLAIGNVAQIELEPARAAAKRFFAEATLGKDPLKARAEARAKARNTVGVVIEQYLAKREPVARPNTYRHLDRYLNRYFASLHGHAVEAVTRRDVAVAIAEVARVHGEVSAARARSALSAFYTWALKEGLAGESNPVAFTNDPAPGEKPRDRVLSAPEIRAIWHSLPNNEFGRITRLLFYTACRRQEIGSLEWSEIDFDKSLLVIPGNKMKGGVEHRLPLTPEAVGILKSIPCRADNPFVFGVARRGFTSFSYYHDELRKALSATGSITEPWRLHDIRRTIRSELGDLGVEPWIAEQILAHVRAGIEDVYNKAKLEKQMRTALQMWADRLRSIVEGTESTVVPMRMPA
jgi:integrase